MTSWYYSANRGSNLKGSSLTLGTSSTSGNDMELRVNALDAQSKAIKKKDVHDFLCQLAKFILSNGTDGADPSSARGGTDLPPN